MDFTLYSDKEVKSDITLIEIDESLKYLKEQFNTDVYGNRMNWHKSQELMLLIDKLLDKRIEITRKVNQNNGKSNFI